VGNSLASRALLTHGLVSGKACDYAGPIKPSDSHSEDFRSSGKGIFAGIADIMSVAQVRTYSAGCAIFQQGADANMVFSVRSGWIELSRIEPSGRALKKLVGPGVVLGVECVVTLSPHPVTARAITESELLAVERKVFNSLLDSHPRLVRELLTTLSLQLQNSLEEFFEVAAKVPSFDRLLRILQELARDCGRETEEGICINLPLSLQDLADKVGCSRQWASKIVNELEASGTIRRKGRWITMRRSTRSGHMRLVAG
jgi:CRP-like cAMP-binding protein